MPRFRKLLILPLLAAFALLPRPGFAALISRFDLESLCYVSTDAVEATLVRHHAAGHQEWEDRFTATVVSAIAGQYKPGDKIGPLDLYLYAPNADGQRCILFITRKEIQFDTLSPKRIPPKAVDMLLIDSRNQVWRYYQWSNPGGLTAADGSLGGRQGQFSAASPETHGPALAAERAIIAAKWAAVDHLRPLLARKPARADVPALQALVRTRRCPSGPGLQNLIVGLAEERLARLYAEVN